jgi:hypothetical protein
MRSCSRCRALIEDYEDPCRYCGEPLAGRLRDNNPYAAPTAPIAEGPSHEATEVAPSTFGKVGQAFQVLFANLVVLVLLDGTISLPLHVLSQVLAQGSPDETRPLAELRFYLYGQGVFGPISQAAVVWALAAYFRGQRPRYGEALRTGFRNWGRLWGSRFVAGFFILLGLILLVVPGLILAVRYALIDSVVVLEGRGVSASRVRS